MDRISINLLPPELKLSKKKEKKKQLAVRISVSVLVLMIIITGSLIGMSVMQSSSLETESRRLESLQTQVSTYKEAEGIAYLLKNRLSGIEQAAGRKFPQTEAFNMLTQLTPDLVNLYAFKVDKASKVNLQGLTDYPGALETYFTNLTDPKINEGKVTKVTVNSLNKGTTNTIRFDLNIGVTGL